MKVGHDDWVALSFVHIWWIYLGNVKTFLLAQFMLVNIYVIYSNEDVNRQRFKPNIHNKNTYMRTWTETKHKHAIIYLTDLSFILEQGKIPNI